MKSKYNAEANAWHQHEDDKVIKGMEEGLSYRQIKEKYFADSDRTVPAINKRGYKLRGGQVKSKPEPLYWIETGFKGMFFHMDEPHKDPVKRYQYMGSAATHIMGMPIIDG